MNHVLTTIDNQALDAVARLICNVLPAEAVFIASSLDAPNAILTVITDAASDRDEEEMLENVRQLIPDNSHLLLRSFNSVYAAREIGNANLYFACHCLYGSLLFSTLGSVWSDKVINKDRHQICGATKQNFTETVKKIESLIQDAESTAALENLVDAALLLHFAIIETFRTAACFTTGKSSPSQILATQRASLCGIEQEIQILPQDLIKDVDSLISSIESAYECGFNNTSLSVTTTGYNALKLIATAAVRNVERLFLKHLNHFDVYQVVSRKVNRFFRSLHRNRNLPVFCNLIQSE
ncbi:MAG TPA: hypothetical protein VGB44_00430 [Flavobacterium sp.]